MSKMLLEDWADKYYTELNDTVNDLAQKYIGGEKCKLSFSSGTITIKIK